MSKMEVNNTHGTSVNKKLIIPSALSAWSGNQQVKSHNQNLKEQDTSKQTQQKTNVKYNLITINEIVIRAFLVAVIQ